MAALSGKGRRGLRNGSAEVGDGGDPAEEFLDIVDRGLLNEVRSEMMDGVLEHDAEIFEVEGVAQRRLHADIGGDAGEHQRADAARAQHAVDVGVEKAAVTGFWNDDVAWLW